MSDLFRNQRGKIIHVLIDIFFINLALIGGYILHPRIDNPFSVIISGSIWGFYRTFALMTVIIRLFWLLFFGIYEIEKETPSYKSIEKIFKSTTLSSIIIFTTIHGLRNYYLVNLTLSRYTCFIEWGLNIIFLFGWRVFYFHFLPQILQEECKQKNTLIVGVSEEGLHYFTELSKVPFHHWQVIGYLTYHKGQKESKLYQNASLRCLDDTSNFLEIINHHQVENVILASHEGSPEQIDELISQSNDLGIRVFILPRLYETFARKLKLQPMESMPIFEVVWEPIKGFNQVLKRLFDVVFSLILITLCLPLMALISVAIKLTSKGPVLFKQIRIGKDNKPFVIYKFRSMIENAEQVSGPVWAESDDPRVTNIGRFLRKTSLDELPQLFLVLLGKLSVVGPRPERPHFVNKFKDFQGLRLRIKPGLTGLAQINGRYEANLSDKIYHDIYYINNYSFYLDMAIVAKTLWSVITGHGAR